MSKYRLGRQHPRFVSADRINVVVNDAGSGPTEGVVTNVSTYGACIVVAHRRFAPGARVLLQIFFPRDDDPFVCEAEIVWSRTAPSGVDTAHGLRFVMMEDAERRELEAVLNRPEFSVESSEDPGGRAALDEMMLDLTEDLDLLAQRASRKLGGAGAEEE